MTKCDYCSSTIIFGGKHDANGRFCNQKCQGRGALLAISRQIPESVVREQIWKIHQGPCPNCGGMGPVDVHVVHKVWSALLLTSWSSTPQVSCQSCGRKSQFTGIVFSLVLGWWGFPWGLLLTPIQIGRNLVGIGRSADASTPSPQLQKTVRMMLAAQAVTQQPEKAAASAAGPRN
jgi:hypothetical protein